MRISKQDLQCAVDQNIISFEQANALWNTLESKHDIQPKFDLAHLAYYFGAMLDILAMGWFLTISWEQYGGESILFITSVYAISFIFAGHYLWYKQHLKIPGGLLYTMAVCMTPLIIYGFQEVTGLWSHEAPNKYQDFHVWIKSTWFFMELGTIVAGLITLKFIRFPFITAPIAFALWYMSMDLAPLLLTENFSWDDRLWVSLWFGLAMILTAYLIDRRTKADFAFWLYLFGMMSFWGGLSLMDSGDEFSKFIYFLINLSLMLLAIILQRRVFIVFGSLGVLIYFGHLAYQVFEDVLLFPIALVLLGISVIYLGIQYQRHHRFIEHMILKNMPAFLKALSPVNRVPPQK